MAGNSSDHGRSVTSKVVSLLEAFLPHSRELSLGELASRTGLPSSTTYRLATELVDWGGLQRGENGGYQIGLLLQEIGALAAAGSTLQAVVTPFMRDLHEATQETVQLVILSGRQALCIEKIVAVQGGTGTGDDAAAANAETAGPAGGSAATATSGAASRTIVRSTRLPLHATSGGKVLLAHAAPAFVDRVLTAGLERYTGQTIVGAAALRRTLAEIRRTGVGFDREELTGSSSSVAAPVFDSTGAVVAAISLVQQAGEGGAIRPSLARLAPAVLAISLSASRALRSQSIRVNGQSWPPSPDRVP